MTRVSAQSAATSALSDNALINGAFDVWQGARSFNAAAGLSQVTADFWHAEAVGLSGSVSRGNMLLGQTDVPGNPPHSLDTSLVTPGVGASDRALVCQAVAKVALISGQPVTLEFYAQASVAANMAVELQQYFGNLGSARVDGIGVTTCALTTPWKRFVITVALPSVAGKTISSSFPSILDYLGVLFWFDAGSAFNARTNSLGHQAGTFKIAQVALYPGTRVQPLRVRPFNDVLNQCQERRWKSFPYDTVPAANTGVTGAIRWGQNVGPNVVDAGPYISFPRRMLYAPASVLYNPSQLASAQVRNLTDSTNCTLSSATATERGFSISHRTGTGMLAGETLAVHALAEAQVTPSL